MDGLGGQFVQSTEFGPKLTLGRIFPIDDRPREPSGCPITPARSYL